MAIMRIKTSVRLLAQFIEICYDHPVFQRRETETHPLTKISYRKRVRKTTLLVQNKKERKAEEKSVEIA